MAFSGPQSNPSKGVEPGAQGQHPCLSRSGCCNGRHLTGWVRSCGRALLTVLGAGRPKSRCRQGHLLENYFGNYFPRPQLLTPPPVEVRISACEFGGNANTQTVATPKPGRTSSLGLHLLQGAPGTLPLLFTLGGRPAVGAVCVPLGTRLRPWPLHDASPPASCGVTVIPSYPWKVGLRGPVTWSGQSRGSRAGGWGPRPPARPPPQRWAERSVVSCWWGTCFTTAACPFPRPWDASRSQTDCGLVRETNQRTNQGTGWFQCRGVLGRPYTDGRRGGGRKKGHLGAGLVGQGLSLGALQLGGCGGRWGCVQCGGHCRWPGGPVGRVGGAVLSWGLI